MDQSFPKEDKSGTGVRMGWNYDTPGTGKPGRSWPETLQNSDYEGKTKAVRLSIKKKNIRYSGNRNW